MFLVDTNILLYAAERSFPHHERARELLTEWRAGQTPWFVTWGILYEFMRVATHPAIFHRPWTWGRAVAFVKAVLESSSVRVLNETQRHKEVLEQVIGEYPDVSGNTVHDAHTAVLMREHGIREIRSLDRHFRRFRFLTVVDPFE